MAESILSEARIEFRLPTEVKRQIEKAAQVSGRTVTDFAKDVLTREAQAVLDQHETISLSDRDRDAFLAMLESDPTPNAALLAAAKRHPKRVAR
jgi:uncharacterized protein (DUF1778 family)